MSLILLSINVCVVPKHALKYMIMCNSNFDHNYLKTKYFNMPKIICYLFLIQISGLVVVVTTAGVPNTSIAKVLWVDPWH